MTILSKKKVSKFVGFIKKTFQQKDLDEGRADKDCQMDRRPKIDQIENSDCQILVFRVTRKKKILEI